LRRPGGRGWRAGPPPEGRAEREAMVARYAPTAEVMLAVLAGLTERHGGVVPYLRSTGLDAGDLERLRRRLVGPARSRVEKPATVVHRASCGRTLADQGPRPRPRARLLLRLSAGPPVVA